MYKILIAIAILTVLGLLLGFLIAFISTKFHVEEDKRLEEIRNLLPGANCGACGNAGCSQYAEKILSKELDTSKCTVIKGEQKEKLIKYVEENVR